jgi:hypothetical protein
MAVVCGVSVPRDVSACGGCFTAPLPPNPPPDEVDSVITDERMIFSVSEMQTTLYDEINFSGSPSSFAWVLPIKGSATVGLSADLLFASLDQLTATQVVAPPLDCPAAPSCGGGGGAGCSSSVTITTPTAGGAPDDGYTIDTSTGPSTVSVTAQVQVGPYETVQLKSTDPKALDNWLAAHGYKVAASEAPVIAAYIAEGFDFLAMKLVPGQGVNAMRPVRVTTQGAGVTLPLRMVGVGTGATTGITLWVIGDGRWEPSNFPTFTITDKELAWDWATESSNYETVRLQHEATLKGAGWEIESSLEMNEAVITTTVTTSNASPDGDAAPGSSDYLPVGGAGEPPSGDAGDDSGADDAGSGGGGEPYESADQVEQDDLTTLFAGMNGPNIRVTRMRSDLAHSALSADLVLQAAADQSELTNLHYPAQQIGEPLCPTYDSNCNQTGEAPRSAAISASSGGCSTTAQSSTLGTQVIAVGCMAFLGLGTFRSRRRGRRAGR